MRKRPPRSFPSRATGCWKRCVSMRGTGWWKVGRRRRFATGISRTSSPSRSSRRRSWKGRARSASSRDSRRWMRLSTLACALSWLAPVVAIQGDPAKAAGYAEESLAQARAAGDIWQVAMALLDLGFAAAREGDFARADALCSESLALFRQRGDAWG